MLDWEPRPWGVSPRIKKANNVEPAERAIAVKANSSCIQFRDAKNEMFFGQEYSS
jgi:hypothetical protein